MRSLKAIVISCMFIVIVFFILQLAYVFIAVGYNSLVIDFPYLKNITGIFRYLIGIPVFMIIMFIGGYIVADIANVHTKIKVSIHCCVVGFLTVGVMMFSAMENSNLTLTGIVVTVLAVSVTCAGGFYWLRDNSNQ